VHEGGSSCRWATCQLGIPESLPHQLRPNRVAFDATCVAFNAAWVAFGIMNATPESLMVSRFEACVACVAFDLPYLPLSADLEGMFVRSSTSLGRDPSRTNDMGSPKQDLDSAWGTCAINSTSSSRS